MHSQRTAQTAGTESRPEQPLQAMGPRAFAPPLQRSGQKVVGGMKWISPRDRCSPCPVAHGRSRVAALLPRLGAADEASNCPSSWLIPGAVTPPVAKAACQGYSVVNRSAADDDGLEREPKDGVPVAAAPPPAGAAAQRFEFSLWNQCANWPAAVHRNKSCREATASRRDPRRPM